MGFNFELLLTLITTVLVAVAGWFIAHLFSSNRERDSKRREIRVQYLLDAWRRLENAVHREDNSYFRKDLETAIADIQLLGTNKQIELALIFAETFANNRGADLDELLNDLRDDLRSELLLEITTKKIKHLRVGT